MEATETRTISDIKRANKNAGQHWFEPATMRFFNSRVGSRVIEGRYFISSEQFNGDTERLYTIREAVNGGTDIAQVGAFQMWESSAQALSGLRRYLKSGATRISGIEDGRWVNCDRCGNHLASFQLHGAKLCDTHLFDAIEDSETYPHPSTVTASGPFYVTGVNNG